MLNSILSSIIESRPLFRGNSKRSKEEEAIQSISDHLKLDFEIVAGAFSQSRVQYLASECGDERADKLRRAQHRECCLSDLRIALSARDPASRRTRNLEIKILEKACKRQAKLVKDIEEYGVQSWDRTFGAFEGQSFYHIDDMYHCMFAELHIRKESETSRRVSKKSGKGLDSLPVFIAKRMADIFGTQGWNIGVGNDPNTGYGPSGPFCKAIVFAFGEFGIEHHFYRPAAEAKAYYKNKSLQK